MDDEYITHLSVRKGAVIDRVEFVTNLGNHFSCGGTGGDYHKFHFDCAEGTHPRVLAFGVGLGPVDIVQLRAHYIAVAGDSPCHDIAFEMEMQRRHQEELARIAAEAEERLR